MAQMSVVYGREYQERLNMNRMAATLACLCLAGRLPATEDAAGQAYPDPVKNPSSPLMLAGDWLPKDMKQYRKPWVDKNLPRMPSQHSIVHDVRDADGTRVNQHNYLAAYGGLYWVIWSDGPGRPNPRIREWNPDHRTRQPNHDIVPGPEQSPQRVRGATSVDGVKWSEPFDVAGDPAPNHGWIARGLWIREGKLLALASQFQPPEYAGPGLSLHAFELQSAKAAAGTPPVWRKLGVICDDALNNFEPQRLPTGEWMMSRRNGKADVFVMIGGVEGLDKWSLIPMVAYEGEAGFKPEEPVSYTLPDRKTLVFLFRDNSKGGFLFRSFSTDNARTWTKPVRTNFPDATSKFYALRLKDGRYVLVSNACQGPRDPLMLSVSNDGLVYRQMGILAGGRQVDYPHVIEHDGHIFVAFASAKQSVEVLKIKLEDLKVLQPVAGAVTAAQERPRD